MAGTVSVIPSALRRLGLPRGVFSPRVFAAAAAPWSRALSQPAPVQEDYKPLGHPWRIVVAVCVQRLPSLSREKTELERKYEQLKDQMRMERSRLSDYELEEREHMRQKRQREKKALEEGVDIETSKQSTLEHFEELIESRDLELSSFQPASKETEADRERDLRSMDRSLDRMLYLLVKKPRTQHSWQMPQGGVDEGESLLQAARRELSEECGPELKVDFLSSAPFAFHSYRHRDTSNVGLVGSKLFFLKAQFRGGPVQLNPEELQDHVWVTKKEMKDFVSEDFYSAVAPTLID